MLLALLASCERDMASARVPPSGWLANDISKAGYVLRLGTIYVTTGIVFLPLSLSSDDTALVLMSATNPIAAKIMLHKRMLSSVDS